MKIISFLACFLLSPFVTAQDCATATVSTTHMIQTPDTLQVEWTAAKNLQSLPSASDITLSYGADAAAFSLSAYVADSITFRAGDSKSIVFSADAAKAPLPGSGVTTFKITIKNVKYSDGSSSSVTATGTIYGKDNIKALVTATQSALCVSKTTQEKDLFAGLNISVPSSTSNGVAGELAYNYTVTSLPKLLANSPLYDSGNVGLDLKAGSTTANNARHFDLGLTARKTVLFISSDTLKTLRKANQGESVTNDDFESALTQARKPFWRAAIFDYGFQMEGDVSTQGLGGVTNILLDARPQLATAALAFGGDKGYFSLRLLPIGTELGHNVAKPTGAAGNVGGLVRAKSALDLNLYYKNPSTNSLVGMIELTGQSMYRYLFESEVAFDPTTNKTTSTASGSHPWNQLDLKIFSSQAYGKVHPGLKVSYQDGTLPPVYSKVHVFTYGLVLESF